MSSKSRAVPKKQPGPEKKEAPNSRGTLIKAVIIGATFLAIALLSLVTQGSGNGRPGAGIVAVRIVLLSACSAVYFLML